MLQGRAYQGQELQAVVSGFAVNAEGAVLTSAHVLRRAERFTVTSGLGRAEVVAALVWRDEETDAALLRATGLGAAPLVFAAGGLAAGRRVNTAWRDFGALRGSNLKVARAWALKEQAMSLWGYQSRGWAARMWKRWHAWAVRSRLPAMVRVARMIKRHWDGVINAATTPVTNAMAESINAKIQRIKRMACGYRNRMRFRHAIYFHLGGLDLYPEICHTKG